MPWLGYSSVRRILCRDVLRHSVVRLCVLMTVYVYSPAHIPATRRPDICSDVSVPDAGSVTRGDAADTCCDGGIQVSPNDGYGYRRPVTCSTRYRITYRHVAWLLSPLCAFDGLTRGSMTCWCCHAVSTYSACFTCVVLRRAYSTWRLSAYCNLTARHFQLNFLAMSLFVDQRWYLHAIVDTVTTHLRYDDAAILLFILFCSSDMFNGVTFILDDPTTVDDACFLIPRPSDTPCALPVLTTFETFYCCIPASDTRYHSAYDMLYSLLLRRDVAWPLFDVVSADERAPRYSIDDAVPHACYTLQCACSSPTRYDSVDTVVDYQRCAIIAFYTCCRWCDFGTWRCRSTLITHMPDSVTAICHWHLLVPLPQCHSGTFLATHASVILLTWPPVRILEVPIFACVTYACWQHCYACCICLYDILMTVFVRLLFDNCQVFI